MTYDSIVATVGAGAAVLQAIFIIASILYLNRQFAIVRACSYIERFNSHENIRRRGTVDSWLASTTENAPRIEAFQKDAALRADILGFLNLFQELGVAFSHHGVHKPTVIGTFDFLVPYYWRESTFLMDHIRTHRSATAYRRFEALAHALSTQPNKIEAEKKKQPAISGK
jgi:hypothetical protein